MQTQSDVGFWWDLRHSFCYSLTVKIKDFLVAERLYCRTLWGSGTLDACTCASTWIKNGLAAMLGVRRSAGAALEVYLKNPLHISDEAYK